MILSYESTKIFYCTVIKNVRKYESTSVLYFRTFESTSGGSARRERARRGEEVARSRSAREAHIIYVDEVDCHETET